MNEQKNLANVGVGVDVNMSWQTAVYLIAVLVIGSAAFFAAKKYIR